MRLWTEVTSTDDIWYVVLVVEEASLRAFWHLQRRNNGRRGRRTVGWGLHPRDFRG